MTVLLRTTAPRISLIVPAHNEEALLPRLLETVAVAANRYAAGARAIEVVVADNASSDRTAEVAREHACVVTFVERRQIAAARNGGAMASRAEILAFVDADSRIHPETFNAIDTAMADRRWVAGATGVWLERWSPGIVVTWALMVPWVWLLRMDTGVVFCRRADFEAIGGYDERRLFGEDVQLLWDLRRLGTSRGQRLVRLRPVKAIASTRKFDRWGDWHYLAMIPRLLPMMLRRPAAANDFVRRYWYGDDH